MLTQGLHAYEVKPGKYVIGTLKITLTGKNYLLKEIGRGKGTQFLLSPESNIFPVEPISKTYRPARGKDCLVFSNGYWRRSTIDIVFEKEQMCEVRYINGKVITAFFKEMYVIL